MCPVVAEERSEGPPELTFAESRLWSIQGHPERRYDWLLKVSGARTIPFCIQYRFPPIVSSFFK